MPVFTIPDAISFGWSKVRENLGLFVAIAVLAGAVTGLGQIFFRWPPLSAPLSWILGVLVEMGLIRFTLRYHDRGQAEFQDLMPLWERFLEFLGGTILYSLIVLGGTILLIVPGIIWGIQYAFYGYLVIDGKLRAMDALHRSAEITRNHKGHLFLLALALAGINLLGVICLGIGLLVTMPISLMAMAYVFRRLSAAAPAGPFQTLPVTTQAPA